MLLNRAEVVRDVVGGGWAGDGNPAPANTGQPPTGNTGVEIKDTEQTSWFEGNLYGKGLDYLTLSMSAEVARDWMPLTGRVDAGRPRPGFRSSEKRAHVGGTGWRRWEPSVESKRWGLAYESWEWDGTDAVVPARWFRGRDVRPSRVDVAWDFSVPYELLADDVAERAGMWMRAKDIKGGVAGEGNVNTRYIGAKGSDRRLRIYRKDLQLESWLMEFGPTLRVELTLKGDHAAAWWNVWASDELNAIDVAAGHVYDLVGFDVQPGRAAVPALSVLDEAVDPAQGVFSFIRQYSTIIDACSEAGIDVFGLVAEHQANRSVSSAWRRKQWLEKILSVGVDRVESAVRAIIAREVTA
jgi:hypothetical protein